MSIQFPNVPDLPGVPPVLRQPGAAINGAETSLDAQLNGLTGGLAGQLGITSLINGQINKLAAQIGITVAFQWGVFDGSGRLVFSGDNIVGIDYRDERDVPTYPVEGGKLESYNKVKRPFDLAVTFTKGGSVSDRATFLGDAQILLDSTDLYTIATPEFSYTSVNPVHIDVRRTVDQGTTLIALEMGFVLIRADAQATFSNTKTPAGAANQNTGPVQAQTPTAAQATAINAQLEPIPEGDG